MAWSSASITRVKFPDSAMPTVRPQIGNGATSWAPPAAAAPKRSVPPSETTRSCMPSSPCRLLVRVSRWLPLVVFDGHDKIGLCSLETQLHASRLSMLGALVIASRNAIEVGADAWW